MTNVEVVRGFHEAAAFEQFVDSVKVAEALEG